MSEESASAETTAQAAVAAALHECDDLGDRPVAEHVDVYERAYAGLVAALDDSERGQ